MALTKVTSGVRTLGTGEVTAANLADGVVDTSGLEDDVALLGFKVASNGSLAKYNLVDQTVDDFQDTSGVDASASTNESRDASGKYYVGETTVTPTVTGGTITTDGDYKVHSFTVAGSTNYVTDTAQTVDYLLVAGGAGGGGHYGGGGGAGGFRYLTGQSLAAGTFAAVVGAKGNGNTSAKGGDGTNSSFNSASATGGGGGAYESGTPANDGGSGGGATYNASGAGSGNEGGYTPVEGYDGGVGVASGQYPCGGGGGSSAVGGTAPDSTTGGVGGSGTANSITGGSVTYAGGGGGSAGAAGTGGTGGSGGGGDGGDSGNGDNATGNGSGGGGGTHSRAGGDGSDGIVIVRRPTTATSQGGNMTLVSTTTAAQAAPTKGDVVLTYTNGAGTTTLDTDLTAEISADGGSTWTALALASEGSTGSHNIATSHDVTISSTITAPYNMAYRVKTLNQSAGSKTTRIQAVSLGWS